MNYLDAERDRATPAWVDADELRFSPLSLHSTVLGRERETETLTLQDHHDFPSFYYYYGLPCVR